MYIALLLSPVLAAGCLLAPAQKSAGVAPAQATISAPFPQPTAGISIAVGPGEDMKLEKLLDEFSKVTGLTLLVDPETRSILQRATTGLNRSIEIPAAEVYPIVETILIRNDIYLAMMHDREPRIASACFLTQGRQPSLRNAAMFVPAKDIGLYAQHPAFLVTTIINLSHTDVRTLSNSMRTIYSDSNAQQMVPIGNSNALMLTGFGGNVASIARMLLEVDETAMRETADVEAHKTPPPGQAPAKEEKPK